MGHSTDTTFFFFLTVLIATLSHAAQTQRLLSLAELYSEEMYILVWKGCKGQVLLQATACPTDSLRALWQVSAAGCLRSSTHFVSGLFW